MASYFKKALLSFSEEDFSCPVCRDIFIHPVVLLCSHSFCEACLHEWWKQKDIKECPVCRKVLDGRSTCNLVLKNLCETVMDPQVMFFRESLFFQESLPILQEKLKSFKDVQTKCDQAAEHIKVQTQNTARKIKEQFKKLHQFLEEEEEARITALRVEEEQKSQTMKEKIEGLNREMSTISNTIRAIEEALRAENISSLQNYKTTVERVQLTLQDPQLASGALIDEAKHLGNLTFRVWDKMKDIVSYTPVILDPNTAYPGDILSDDLTSVLHGDEQQLPDNPERFDYYGYVLGTEGFNSGTHSWVVEVGDNEDWDVGVLADSFQRKGDNLGQHWRVMLQDGRWEAGSRPHSTRHGYRGFTLLSVKKKPWRIRVQLDWNRGELTFSDPDANKDLHTFRHTFTDTLFPYIYNGDNAVPLKMLPRKIRVTCTTF